MPNTVNVATSTTPQLLIKGNGKPVTVHCTHASVPVFIGDRNVSTSNGFQVDSGTGAGDHVTNVALGPGEELWVVSASASSVCAIQPS